MIKAVNSLIFAVRSATFSSNPSLPVVPTSLRPLVLPDNGLEPVISRLGEKTEKRCAADCIDDLLTRKGRGVFAVFDVLGPIEAKAWLTP
jgi:hypothetical protein